MEQNKRYTLVVLLNYEETFKSKPEPIVEEHKSMKEVKETMELLTDNWRNTEEIYGYTIIDKLKETRDVSIFNTDNGTSYDHYNKLCLNRISSTSIKQNRTKE